MISFDWIRHRAWESLSEEREVCAELTNSRFDYFNPHLETRATSSERAARAAFILNVSREVEDERRMRRGR